MVSDPDFLAQLNDAVKDIADMLYGRGAHEGHTLRQIGRCVYCSCGTQAQGRIPKKPKP